ncbi:DUF6127 family protein [Sphingomonas lenta]|uniref:Uncharacterized protein n=1 Tax=Sphingomonas lenta TaxID=1141887 RepID=A0A2A2SCU9_9SPHN|nr:DUF6127 family protein [Sphingomonas lenta]PAX07002.1 hypothetical protein CKY28_13135 [Sphingomonas lenta]
MSGVLAQLLGQAAERGVDAATLRAIAEEAGELGATRALTRLGLSDEGAEEDVRELRDLLRSWREAKRSAWRGLWGWFVRVVSTVLLAGMAVELGTGGWLE